MWNEIAKLNSKSWKMCGRQKEGQLRKWWSGSHDCRAGFPTPTTVGRTMLKYNLPPEVGRQWRLIAFTVFRHLLCLHCVSRLAYNTSLFKFLFTFSAQLPNKSAFSLGYLAILVLSALSGGCKMGYSFTASKMSWSLLSDSQRMFLGQKAPNNVKSSSFCGCKMGDTFTAAKMSWSLLSDSQRMFLGQKAQNHVESRHYGFR